MHELIRIEHAVKRQHGPWPSEESLVITATQGAERKRQRHQTAPPDVRCASWSTGQLFSTAGARRQYNTDKQRNSGNTPVLKRKDKPSIEANCISYRHPTAGYLISLLPWNLVACALFHARDLLPPGSSSPRLYAVFPLVMTHKTTSLTKASRRSVALTP